MRNSNVLQTTVREVMLLDRPPRTFCMHAIIRVTCRNKHAQILTAQPLAQTVVHDG